MRGQQAIEPERVTEIQLALIREHYLNEEANGEWDAATIAAMQKYQADQGWQTKLTPDSRALKKLGLGPDYSNAINAKDSSFGEPPPAARFPKGNPRVSRRRPASTADRSAGLNCTKRVDAASSDTNLYFRSPGNRKATVKEQVHKLSVSVRGYNFMRWRCSMRKHRRLLPILQEQHC